MSLIKCPECGKDMSDKAPSCPNCGCPAAVAIIEYKRRQADLAIKTKREEEEKKIELERKMPVYALFIILTLAIVIGTGYSIVKSFEDDKPASATPYKYSPSKESLEGDAYFEASEYVRRFLKSPSTAKFPRRTYARIQLLDDGVTYKIFSYVDGQNSFGAMIRTNWYVKIMRNGQNWRILDIQIYDR